MNGIIISDMLTVRCFFFFKLMDSCLPLEVEETLCNDGAGNGWKRMFVWARARGSVYNLLIVQK